MSKSRRQTLFPPEPVTHTSNESTARILAVAESLFAEHGFEAVSMNTIAERAGVSKANIFHHFSSKRELYLAVLRNACEQTAERMQTLEARTGTFEQRFKSYAVDMLKDILDRESLHRLVLRELTAEDGSRMAQELAERVFGDKFARLVSILRDGQSRGELRSDFNPAMAAITLMGMNVFFMQSRHVFKHLPDARAMADSKQYSALLADILLRGIAASPE